MARLRVHSTKVSFFPSATPFWFGVLAAVSWWRILLESKNVVNAVDKYSPLHLSKGIQWEDGTVWTDLWNCWKWGKTSDLRAIGKTHENREKLSVMVRKYQAWPRETKNKGPQKSKCKSSGGRVVSVWEKSGIGAVCYLAKMHTSQKMVDDRGRLGTPWTNWCAVM